MTSYFKINLIWVRQHAQKERSPWTIWQEWAKTESCWVFLISSFTSASTNIASKYPSFSTASFQENIQLIHSPDYYTPNRYQIPYHKQIACTCNKENKNQLLEHKREEIKDAMVSTLFPVSFGLWVLRKKSCSISSWSCVFLNTESCPILKPSTPASTNALKQCIKREYIIYLPKYLQCLETSVLCQENSNTQHNTGNETWK